MLPFNKFYIVPIYYTVVATCSYMYLRKNNNYVLSSKDTLPSRLIQRDREYFNHHKPLNDFLISLGMPILLPIITPKLAYDYLNKN